MMRNLSGVTRKFDELGRVTIPKEIRENLCLAPGSIVDVRCEDGQIILTPVVGISPSSVIKSISILEDGVVSGNIKNKEGILDALGGVKKIVEEEM